MATLNQLLRHEPALFENQFNQKGFEWIDLEHRQETVISFKRKGKKRDDDLLIILNLTPVVRNDWEIVTTGKLYTKEIFNSDEKKFGGSANVFNPQIRCNTLEADQKKYSLLVNLPPLAGIILK